MSTEDPRDQDAGRAAGDSFDFGQELSRQHSLLRERLANAEKLTSARMTPEERIGIAAFTGYLAGPLMLARAQRRRKRRNQPDA